MLLIVTNDIFIMFYVTDENRDKVCYRCDFQDAVCELKRAFEESWMYKFMVKLLDWLEDKLEK